MTERVGTPTADRGGRRPHRWILAVLALVTLTALLTPVALDGAAAQSARVVGMASAPDGRGYLVVYSDGEVRAFGTAVDRGDLAAVQLDSPIVNMVATPDGRGYWLFAADGGVFPFGSARFHGSAADLPLVRPIVAGAPTPDGGGYWLFASDGGVFSYGNARFHGSVAAIPLDEPVIGMTATPNGGGYHLLASDGGVFALGNAPFFGSGAERGVEFSAFAATPNLNGYWLFTPGGQLQQFGLAPRVGAPVPGPPTAPSTTSTPTTAPPTSPPTTQPGGTTPLDQIDLRYEDLDGNFSEPIALTNRGENGIVYVAEREGYVLRVRLSDGDTRTILDISDLTSTESERGLLDLAFSPDGSKLYLNHTDDGDGGVRVVEYAIATNGVVDVSSRRVLLAINQPFPNHNGGGLEVTADGMLWIASGDGGSGGDPGNNGQTPTNLLGALLRIDPRPGAGRPYTIPADNPFVSDSSKRDELWAWGLRNPWRFTVDPATGDVWIADVGQGRREEVNFQAGSAGGGQNYGWRIREGDLSFNANDPNPGGLVDPIHVYTHGGGRCSITGGVVYRGSARPELRGTYLFGDVCTGQIWGMRQQNGRRTEVAEIAPDFGTVVDFGTDAAGEVYLVSLDGFIARLA